MPEAAADAAPVTHEVLLENGFQAVWEEDHHQPLVAIEARIKGGLRAEGPLVGTGVTHFMEHMLFKGTVNRPPGTIEQEVRRYGGTINAYTSFDTTGVTLFVEASRVREALEMIADILQNAVFPEEEFKKEREVIISEIQMNLDDPSRRVHRLFFERHFLEHPYRHPVLGYRELLEKLTVEELRAFYAQQYQPQNITLACVGDFQSEVLASMIHEVFGGWARGRVDPLQRIVAAEPEAASSRTATIELPIQAAYAMLGFTSTRLSDPDLYALDVLSSILGNGKSSRLHEALVRKARLAESVHSWNYTPYDPGVFGISMRTTPERLGALQKAVEALLEQIKQEGVSREEVQKAKRQVIAEYEFSRQTMESRAGDLASSMESTGDPNFSKAYVEGVRLVTPEKVQDVARRYCDLGRMTMAVVRPPASVTGQVQRFQAEPTLTKRQILDNGLTVLISEDHRLHIAAVMVAFRGGTRIENDDQEGLSNLTSRMLTQGTKRRSASTIASFIESLGGSLTPFSGRDGFGVSLQVLSEDLDAGLDLLHEVITTPSFPKNEFEIQRQLVLKELEAQEDEIFDVGSRLFRQTLFTEHPYRLNPLGSKESIEAFTTEDSRAFAEKWMVPKNMVISVVGDVEAESVMQQLVRSFGRLTDSASPWPAELSGQPIGEVRRAAKSVPKEQALVIMGFRGTTRAAPDRYALDVLTAIFSGMAGRLFQSIREQEGLSYTLGAANVPAWDPGYLLFYAATRPEEQKRVAESMEQQLSLALEKGFTDEELSQAQEHLIGSHRMGLQGYMRLAERAGLDELYGVGFDSWQHYEDQIRAITLEDLKNVAERYLTLSNRAQVVISPNGHGSPAN